MTPERLRLSGFLSYREPQELDFADRSLWLVAGTNGSGKSTLFDAITFALYHMHRGGSRDFQQLINHHADRLEVAFDFRLGDALYRATRTYDRKGRSVRCISERDTAGDWHEVAGTDSQEGFDAWVARHVGMDEKTFLASVMLRQGEADSLLNNKPTQRHKFLGEIVGLDRFERLATVAKERKNARSAEAKHLRERQAAREDVTAEDVRSAEARASEAVAAREDASRSLEDLSTRIQHATRWQDVSQRIDKLTASRDSLDRLLTEGETIRTAADRLEELRTHLPGLRAVVDAQGEVDKAREQFRKLTTRNQQLTRAGEDLAARDRRCRAEHTTAVERLTERKQTADRLAEIVSQRKTIAPWLSQAVTAAASIAETDRRRDTIQEAFAERERERGTVAETRPTDAVLSQADSNLQAATKTLGEAEAELRTIEQRRASFRDNATGPTCRSCGQELTAEHRVTEEARLRTEHEQATDRLRRATSEHTTATERHTELGDKRRCVDQALRTIDADLVRLTRDRDRTEAERTQAVTALRAALTHVPTSARTEWQDSERPTAAEGERFANDLTQSRADADAAGESLAAAEREATALRQKLEKLEAELTTLKSSAADFERDHGIVKERLSGAERRLGEALRSLPAVWRGWDTQQRIEQASVLDNERQQLEDQRPIERREALREAETRRELVAQQLVEATTERDKIPEDAHCDPSELTAERDRLKGWLAELERAARAAEAHRDTQRKLLAEREQIATRLRIVDRERHTAEELERHLGRQGVQRELVRRAERRIVQYANAILDRLSGGALALELQSESGADQALDLCVRADGEPETTAVAFLSGSQRFRVAVSLALAIGEYAGDASRPARAVVIDEGFGCLDREGRQLMIDELHHLAGHLDRIVVVSHQEEVAASIPDGYRCVPTDRGTVIEPLT